MANPGRIQQLLKRMQHLEESMPADENGCCENLALFIYNTIRSIPYLPIACIVPSVLGAGLVIWYSKKVSVATESFEMGGEIGAFVTHLEVIAILVLVVDLLAVLAAIPATGYVRESLFGHQTHGCWSCLKCMVGQCMIAIVMCLLLVTYLATFAGIFAVIPSVTLLGISAGACGAGEASVAAMSKLFSYMEHLEAKSVETAFDSFCKAGPMDVAVHASHVALGIVLLHVGQAWMMTAHANSGAMEEMQNDVDAQAEKVALARQLKAKHHSHYGAA